MASVLCLPISVSAGHWQAGRSPLFHPTTRPKVSGRLCLTRVGKRMLGHLPNSPSISPTIALHLNPSNQVIQPLHLVPSNNILYTGFIAGESTSMIHIVVDCVELRQVPGAPHLYNL
ncbi:hypothetical protein PCANC_14579 [Puccinia coronata f. sp. avenae]|uniref:Uncharacterized protein n=1 Tax=Puccinia coronata f. sp. avenae TaxID=200324 RepID=A0A2N5UGB6_9BASI|nr:hypothetical protein PCANC_14579 [Puccinia coronata f. sp. avenae]